jgi:transposase-like protein
MAKKFSTEEKMVTVFEGLRESKTIAEICKEHGITQSLYYKWRDKFLEGVKAVLGSSGNSSKIIQYQRKIEELEQIISKR